MKKEFEGLEKDPKAEIHIDLLNTKKYQTGKRQAMMEYIDSSSFIRDKHSK